MRSCIDVKWSSVETVFVDDLSRSGKEFVLILGES